VLAKIEVVTLNDDDEDDDDDDGDGDVVVVPVWSTFLLTMNMFIERS
jgi:hypothetical protein